MRIREVDACRADAPNEAAWQELGCNNSRWPFEYSGPMARHYFTRTHLNHSA